jgi:plastocyanin
MMPAIAAIATIAAGNAYWRHLMTARAYSSGATMKLVRLALPLLALASAAGCGSERGAPGPVGPNTVAMTEYEFTPKNVNAARGAELTVRNDGQIAHNLTVKSRASSSKKLIGTDSFLGGRSEKLAVDLSPGRYAIVCTVPGHEQLGMVGTLTVK